MSERGRAPVPANDDSKILSNRQRPPLAQRLLGMTDYQLMAHHMAATRIVTEIEHAKHDAALRALPLIEAEVRRRSTPADPRLLEEGLE
jgi:hypothetical protein